MTGLFSEIIGLIIGAVLAPQWFSNLAVSEDCDAYKIFFRLIYPKWLSFKQHIKYNIIIKIKFRFTFIIPRISLKSLGWCVQSL